MEEICQKVAADAKLRAANFRVAHRCEATCLEAVDGVA